MASLPNRRIVLGVAGGIAAYKSADLVRRLRDRNFEVRVVMTASARRFVTPLTFQAVSSNPVHCDLLDPQAEAGMGHIELARWADLVLIAPATANVLARLAHGFADDLLTTVCLATSAPLVLAPAMNQQMWRAGATQANAQAMLDRGVAILGPAQGDQACGDVGPGRMLEPEAIAERVAARFRGGALEGIDVLVTAGPTREALDPVRYLTNHSSGRMGYAVAGAAAEAGARVSLVSGPTGLATPPGLERIDVASAEEMYAETMARAPGCDIFIAAAAVADYRPAHWLGAEDQEGGWPLHAGARADSGHPRQRRGHGGRPVHGGIRGRDRVGSGARAGQAGAQGARHDRGEPCRTLRSRICERAQCALRALAGR